MRAGWVAVIGVALAAASPGVGGAQSLEGLGGFYTDQPLDQIQRAQRAQLDANRTTLSLQNQNRFQQQLDLERATLEEARRQREGYLYTENTQQRSVETQLREDELRLRQQDESNHERELQQYIEEQQQAAQARQEQGLK